MLTSGVMERVTARERLHLREEVSDQPARNASWRGFFVSIIKDPTSIKVMVGGLITGSIGTWIGIRERSPEVAIGLPAIILLAEGLYLVVKGCQHAKDRRHAGDFGNLELITGSVPISKESRSIECVRLINEQASCSEKNVQTVNPESTVTDMDFLKEFENKYFGSYGADFNVRVAIFQELKHRFPNYFSNHKNIDSQLLIEDQRQCRTMVEGIFKCYRHKLKTQDQYQILGTVDQGDCMYAAVWQGVPSDKKEQLLNEFRQELTALEAQVGEGDDQYLVLKVLLNKAAGKEQYRELILKNGKSQGPDAYNTIDEYRHKMMDNSVFWGRHNIEGWILAKELDCNLVLITGCNYTAEVGFVDRDDETVYESRTANTTLYIDNSFEHYSAAERKIDDIRNGVSRN